MTGTPRERLRIIVSGMIAAVPHHGGATWAVLQYLLGFARLGHEVTFVEELDPSALDEGRSESVSYMSAVAARFGLVERCALLGGGTMETAGLGYDELRAIARGAD